MSYPDRYLLFIEYFNRAKFMSAQTTLDEVWIQETGSDKDFYGGLIQVSVSMYHLTNGNPKGAVRIYQKAKDMISKYGDTYKDIKLSSLLAHLDDLFAKDLDPDQSEVEFLKMVPQIEFLGELA